MTADERVNAIAARHTEVVALWDAGKITCERMTLSMRQDVVAVILDAERAAEAKERKRVAHLCASAEPWIGKEWADQLVRSINEPLESPP